MEVDHFDPSKRNQNPQDYDNLFLSSRHCNLFKGNKFPSEEDRQEGVRLLNPCEESDYNLHLLENPETHELVGVTAAGRYQIRILDLNAPHLIEERSVRSETIKILKRLEKFDSSEVSELRKNTVKILEYFIPPVTFVDQANPTDQV